MEEMIRQIRAASAVGLYYLALFGALTLPDICGALASDDARASGSKYKAWVRDNVPARAGNADLIYGLRCSLLHQGQALPQGSTFPVAFMSPAEGTTPQLHNVYINVGGQMVFWLSIPVFIEEMTGAAEAWFARYGGSPKVTRNMAKFARLRPEGLPPYVANAPVIA